MRYLALATDYDGTLAHGGRADEQTVEALDRIRASGRKLILVTGRELEDLKRVFTRLDLFDRVVAENGALLYVPATRTARPLAPPPPEAFVAELRRRGVVPLSVGHSIVATWEPQENIVLATIRDLGLELQVIFNKGAVMILAPGVNKSSGLEAALAELGLSPHDVVAIGDAENAHALLEAAEYAVAVANAVPMLKEGADYVTRADHGAGVVELIDAMLEGEHARLQPRLSRRSVMLGSGDDGTEVRVPTAGFNLLIAGTSGSGKSTLSASVLEQLMAQDYQCCVIDPEGDYGELPGVIAFGSPQHPPSTDEILTALDRPEASIVVNLLGMPLADRPAFFAELLSHLQGSRARSGRPHWILIDEAHHLCPAEWEPPAGLLGEAFDSTICVTVHPESLAPALLQTIDVVAALGNEPDDALANVARGAGLAVPAMPATALGTGKAWLWFLRDGQDPMRLRVHPPQAELMRHKRKYALGELGPDRSFYFRGPEGKLNLRAQNLFLFLQIADGVDDATWLHHLRRGDYSRWFADCVKDAETAGAVAEIEAQADELSADVSRKRIRALIEGTYTLPAKTVEPAHR